MAEATLTDTLLITSIVLRILCTLHALNSDVGGKGRWNNTALSIGETGTLLSRMIRILLLIFIHLLSIRKHE